MVSSPTISTAPRASSGWATSVGLVLALASVSLGCATTLAPAQRQELETQIHDASYDQTIVASRDALTNLGFWIASSDVEGGLLSVTREVRTHDPRKALTLSILLPSAGDVYLGRFGWAVVNLLLWPTSIVWAAPYNYHLARRMTKVSGTSVFEDLGAERTRVRIALVGVPWDTEHYPVMIRRIHEEIARQLFLRAGEGLAERDAETE